MTEYGQTASMACSGQLKRFETKAQYLEYLAEKYDENVDILWEEYREFHL